MRCGPVTQPVKAPGHSILRPSLGVWIWTGNNSLDLADMKRLGYRWIAVKAFDGDSTFNVPAYIDWWREEAWKHGLMFGIWGYTRSPTDASLAAALVSRFKAQFFIADAEVEYEGAYLYSRMFAQRFRVYHPKMYAALSSFGRIDFHTLDWRGWRDNGFAFMPQAYQCDSLQLAPNLCVSHALAVWKRSEIQPTLGTYQGALGRLSASQLAASVKGLGLPGVNLWEASSTSREDLTAIAEAM